MDAPGQDRIEMRHQCDVIAVIGAEVGKVVAICLAPRERLFEQREAARHRIAPDIDDPRVRQHQVDQPGVQEIAGKLVDQPSLARAMDRGAREIVGAERGEIGVRNPADRGRIHRVTLREIARERGDVGQFGRAVDRAVACQDLLDQRRARARHAEHEDRTRFRTARRPVALEQRRVERRDRPGDEIVERLRIVRLERGARRVAAGIMVEGLAISAGILERLAKREIEIGAVGRIGRRRRRKRAHPRHLGGIEAHGLEIGQAPIGLAEPRLERDRAAIGRDSLRLSTDCAQRMPERVPRLGIVGGRGDQHFIDADRRRGVAELQMDRRREREEGRQVGMRPQRDGDRRERRFRAFHAVQRDRIGEPGRGEIRRHAADLRQQLGDRGEASLPQADIGEQPHRADIVEVDPETRLQRRARCGIAVLEEQRGELAERAVADPARDPSRLRRVRLGAAPEQQQLVAERMPRQRRARIGVRRARQRRDRRRDRAGPGKRHAELILHAPRVRLAMGERLQRIARRVMPAGAAQRCTEQETGFGRRWVAHQRAPRAIGRDHGVATEHSLGIDQVGVRVRSVQRLGPRYVRRLRGLAAPRREIHREPRDR